jgi:hypothetical protein
VKIIALATLLVISGCAISHVPTTPNPTYNIQFEAKPNLPEKNIRWIVVEDISSHCQNKMPQLGSKRVLACSEYNNKACTIYTGKVTDMAQIGHELRHCFEGQWHP